METLIKLTALFLIQICLAAKKKPEEVDISDICKDKLSAAINKFAIDMYLNLSDNHPGENVFFSPISITTALSMLMIGARGKTKSEMEKVLYTTDIQACLHETYRYFEENLYGIKKGPVLESANKLYPDETFDVIKDFEKDINTYYGATVEKLDYKDPTKSMKIINNWVSKRTDGMIPNVLGKGSIDQDTVMLLINAIYFKGDWLNKFDVSDTSSQIFTTESNEKINVNMMYQEDLFNHYYDTELGAQFLELPYKGEGVDIRMVIILPDIKVSITGLQSRLTDEKLSKALDELQYWPTPTYLHLPRFDLKGKYQLHDILEEMGMEELFSHSVNLAGVSTDPRLDISVIIHEAAVIVNENGTEASAVAVVGGGRSGYIPDPATVKCDRPFLFLIRQVQEEKVGWQVNTIPCPILFFGKVSRPEEASEAVCNEIDLNKCRADCRPKCYQKIKQLDNEGRKKNKGKCQTWVGLMKAYRKCKSDCRKKECTQKC